MAALKNLPWLKINDFLLSVGKFRDPFELSREIVYRITNLIPHDKARLHFLSDTGKISHSILIGVDKKWNDAYIEYYSHISNDRFALSNRLADRNNLKAAAGYFNWTDYEHDEFFNHYIKPQRVKYTIGFKLTGNNNVTKCVFALDRTVECDFSEEELQTLSMIQPHLDNLHQNLYANINTVGPMTKTIRLTKREAEIAELLRRGLTPQRVSDHLCISLLTTYKHISNIHSKLNVSNRQELLLKLLELA